MYAIQKAAQRELGKRAEEGRKPSIRI